MSNKNSPSFWDNKTWDSLRSYDTAHPYADHDQYQGPWRTASQARRIKQDETSDRRLESSSSMTSMSANPPNPRGHVCISYRAADCPVSAQGSGLENNQHYTPSPFLGYGDGPSIPSEAIAPTHPNSFTDQKPAELCMTTADFFDSQRENKWAESSGPVLKRPSTTQYAAVAPGPVDIPRKQESLRRGKERADANAEVEEVITRLETAFQDQHGLKSKRWCTTHYLYDTCSSSELKAPDESSKLGKIPSLPTSPSSKKDSTTKSNVGVQPTVAQRFGTAPKRFVDFVGGQTAVRESAQDEKRRHKEWLAGVMEREKRLQDQCERIHEEHLRREASRASRTGDEMPKAPEKDVVEAPTINRAGPSRVDGAGTHVAESASVAETGSETNEGAVLVSKPQLSTASPNLSCPVTKCTPSKRKEQSATKAKRESVARIREAVKVLVTKKEVGIKWTRVDLSDDEDWEKVACEDEGAEWEVLDA